MKIKKNVKNGCGQNSAREAAARAAMCVYIGCICPYCGKELDEDDVYEAIWSDRSKPVHGNCFYNHEADNEWRAHYPEYAPCNRPDEE